MLTVERETMSEKESHTLSLISSIFGIVCIVFGDIPLGICAILTGATAVAKGDDLGYIGVTLGVAYVLYIWFILTAI